MAEEQVVKTEEVKVEAEVEQPSYSETELEAMSMGWKPEEQWEGDKERWIPAKEFVDRKSLFDKIDTQSRRIKDLEKTMVAFKSHYEQVNEAAYQRAVDTLKAQKQEALEADDTKAALMISDQIDEVRGEWAQKQRQQAAQRTNTNQPTETFTTWLRQNQWYAKDTELNGVADGIGVSFYRERPGVSESEVLEHVGKEIRKRYPEKFPTNAARSAPSPVDGSGQRSGARGGAKLPPEAEETMNRLVKAGVMTKEQYMKDWTAVNKGE